MASSPGFLGGIAPAPSVNQWPRQGGLLSTLFQALGGQPQQPVTSALGPVPPVALAGSQPDPTLRSEAPQKPGFLGTLFSPEVGLPTAAALLGQGGDAQNFANAFGAMGTGLKQNKTMNYLRKNNPALAEMVDNGLPINNAFEFMMEERKAGLAGGKPPQVEQFYDPSTGSPYKAMWNARTNSWDRVGGTKGDEGFEVMLADGTTVRQGSFGNQDRKNVANRVTDAQDAAAAGSQLKQTIGLLRDANQNTGYSGVGAGIYGAVDDAAEQFGMGDYLPGEAGARATMRKGGIDAALSMVGKTKGAISNAEMGLFLSGSPGMSNTPEGNAALLDIMEGIADRDIERANQMEQWRQQHGTLDGFERAWGDYVNANPLIVSDGRGGIALASGGNAGGGLQPGQSRDLGGGVSMRRTR